MVVRLRTPAPNAGVEGAYCRDEDPDLFFDEEEEALAVCNDHPMRDEPVCPMRDKCLYFALKNNEAYGVWGGMLPVDRTELRRFTPEEDWAWHPPIERDEDGKPVSSPQAASRT